MFNSLSTIFFGVQTIKCSTCLSQQKDCVECILDIYNSNFMCHGCFKRKYACFQCQNEPLREKKYFNPKNCVICHDY